MSVEDCLKYVPNKFDLVVTAAKMVRTACDIVQSSNEMYTIQQRTIIPEYGKKYLYALDLISSGISCDDIVRNDSAPEYHTHNGYEIATLSESDEDDELQEENLYDYQSAHTIFQTVKLAHHMFPENIIQTSSDVSVESFDTEFDAEEEREEDLEYDDNINEDCENNKCDIDDCDKNNSDDDNCNTTN